MHELSLAEEMLEIVLDRAQKDSCEGVKQVNLTLGALSHVETDALQFCFDSVVKNSIAEGAVLNITRINAAGKCSDCGAISPMTQLYDACPECGKFGLNIIEGQELKVTSIEVY